MDGDVNVLLCAATLRFVSELRNYLAAKRRELQNHVEQLQKKNDMNANLSKYKKETWCLCLCYWEIISEIYFTDYFCFSVFKVTELYGQLRNLEQECHNDNTGSLTIASKCLMFFDNGWICIISIWSFNGMAFSRAEGGAEDQIGGADSRSSFHPG